VSKAGQSDLERDVQQINYALRASFFYRRLKDDGLFGLLEDVATIARDSRSYSWEERVAWKVTHGAWTACEAAQLAPAAVFAHPKVLLEHPHLIAYYRNVAVLPRKGVQYLAFNVAPLERPSPRSFTYSQALQLAKLFNTHISGLLESTRTLALTHIHALLFSSAGASLDGSWRNRLGVEAELAVRTYLLRHAIERNWVSGLIDAKGRPQPYDQAKDYLSEIEHYNGFKLCSGCSVKFGQEPDVTIMDAGGRPACAIEVKGGKDPAGALERLGAVKKSFAAAKEENHAAHTVLVASCITDEMARRAGADPLIDEVRSLTQMISEPSAKEAFLKSLGPYFGFTE